MKRFLTHRILEPHLKIFLCTSIFLPNVPFKCVQNDCLRVYSSLNSFRRQINKHVVFKSKHVELSSESLVSPGNNILNHPNCDIKTNNVNHMHALLKLKDTFLAHRTQYISKLYNNLSLSKK